MATLFFNTAVTSQLKENWQNIYTYELDLNPSDILNMHFGYNYLFKSLFLSTFTFWKSSENVQ